MLTYSKKFNLWSLIKQNVDEYKMGNFSHNGHELTYYRV